MTRTNFKIAVRSLWKNRFFSLINVFGLTIGLSSCLLIALYIQNETSFDEFQQKGRRIARVIMEYNFDGDTELKRVSVTSTKVAPVFVQTFPEIESAVKMRNIDVIVRQKDNPVTESNFMFADSTFFEMFAFTMLQGNAAKALDGPHKVVLTESTAKRYFGDESPIGKIILTGENEVPYEVTGLLEDYPANSQIKFDFLASFSSLGENQQETYWDANYTTYLLLRDEHDFEPLQKKVSSFMKIEMAGKGASINYVLEPFSKIHLYSEFAAFVPNTSIQYLYILSAVALLILVIVCSTYINLSTARSVERAKEVGIRKSIGAARSQLFWQFIGESFIICFLSILLSILVATLMLPYFNQLTERNLHARALLSPAFLFFSFTLALVVGLMSGSYPAIILSGFHPIQVLKGLFKNSHSGKWIQQTLIIFQFGISIFLIISTIIIQKQLYFIQHAKLGYDRDQVLAIPLILPEAQQLEKTSILKQQLKINHEIIAVSRSRNTPVKIGGGYNMRSDMMAEDEQIAVTGSVIDEDYIKTIGLQIIAGDDVTEQDMKDIAYDDIAKRTYHFVLNEMAARQLGWSPEQAVGKKMFMGSRAGFVRAVVRNFHFESMHAPIRCLALFPELRSVGQLLVKVNTQDLPETISFIEAKWKQVAPYMPFEYRFLDDEYATMYRTELQLGSVMNLFAGIAIVLACFGLLGLSSYVAQQRIKEIGIRKILGASVFNIVGLLSSKFAKLVSIAILIACPLTYWTMRQWLQDFAYRIEIEWWMFVSAGLGAIAIALLTVSFHAASAALSNPALSLKSE
ncbi:MAG TPA: ABC transporter permease [Chryseolinea sp.]|nr:ABC transporter permease [Chryseolinea sp.]